MDIFEMKLKVYLTDNIMASEALDQISNLIDTCLMRSDKYSNLHNKNSYKFYVYNSFHPVESDKVYKAGKIYTIVIRTVDKELYEYLKENIKDERTEKLKALELISYKLPENHIERLYSITPVIIKTDSGYWKNSLTLKEYEDRLRINLIKKYNSLKKDKLDENYQIFNMISFHNKTPIGCDYKNISLLGDKVDLVIASNKIAQDLAKIAIGAGIGEMNARGYGFVNYRYL